jgi:hypothetical protein
VTDEVKDSAEPEIITTAPTADYRIVGRMTKPGYHRCPVPPLTGIPLGTVSECGICGTWWIITRGNGTDEWRVASWIIRRQIKKQQKNAEKGNK